MNDISNKKKLGIVVSGGPAPGINGVIHSATIEACTNGLEVVGIYDGFKHLMEGQLVSTPLTIDDVSRIHLKGGSILRTSRANPSVSQAPTRSIDGHSRTASSPAAPQATRAVSSEKATP